MEIKKKILFNQKNGLERLQVNFSAEQSYFCVNLYTIVYSLEQEKLLLSQDIGASVL